MLLGGVQQVGEDVMGRVREARAGCVQCHRRQGEERVPVQELAGGRAPPPPHMAEQVQETATASSCLII